ncbi:MAG: STT3 domain-containing protein [Candidatus Iainarchaeum sp.]
MSKKEKTNKERETNKEKEDNILNTTLKKIYDNRVIIILLLAIFLLAVGVRSDLMKYPGNYLFEPDASYHARMILNLVRDGSVPNPDNLNYYQVEGGIGNQAPSVYWYLSAILYLIISIGQPFSKDLLLWSVKFFPAIFGALISIAMYFLAKEVFNDKRVALITAFLAAITPAFVYRTMSGAQGDNSLGFLWMVIGFYFFVKAVKTKTLTKKDILNSVLAGIFFLIMSMTWRMYILIPTILIPYTLFSLIYIACTSTKEKDVKQNEVLIFIAKIILSLGLFSILFLLGGFYFSQDPVFWLFSVASYAATLIPLDAGIITLLLIAALIIFTAIAYFISNTTKETKKTIWTITVLGLYIVFFIVVALFIVEPDIMVKDRTSISSMVGEESVGNPYFGTKYNALIVLPWLGLILLPLGLFLFKKNDLHPSVLMWVWTLVTLFMAWYKLKFTFVFGLGLVAGGSIVAFIIFEMQKKFKLEKGVEAKITILALIFIVLLGVGATARFVPDYAPFPNQDQGTIDRMDWIIKNTPNDAKFFNWWNEGHVLALTTERRFSTDNRNASTEANQAYARFIITPDHELAYEIASKEIGADYILLESDLIGAMSSFEDYNLNRLAPSEVRGKYSIGNYNILNCVDNNTIISCGGNNIPREQFMLFSDKWKTTPDAFPDGTNPVFYYRTNDQLLILNKAMNNTNFAKVFTNSDETSKYYEEVYSKNGYKIYKILK